MFLNLDLLLFVIAIIYTFLYINSLSKKNGIENERLYFIEGEVTFESLEKHIDNLEKAYNKKYVGVREQLMKYKKNALETNRDFDYYEDYIMPYIKHLELNKEVSFAAAWELFDRHLKRILLLFLLTCVAPFFDILITSEGSVFKRAMFSPVIIVPGIILFAIVLHALKYYLKSCQKNFRSRNENLGAISKSLLAIETFIAALSGKKFPGIEVIHDTGGGSAPSDGVIAVPGFGSGSGGGGNSFGGGRFGGGGAGGHW